MRKRRQVDNQIEPEEIWGKEWQTNPIPIQTDGQLNIEDYYDTSILGIESREEEVRRIMKALPKCQIMHKTIIAGDHLESKIYPIWTNQSQLVREARKNITREAQKNLNHRNAQEEIVRLCHANFNENDIIVHPSYSDRYYPTLERARKDIQNYLNSIKRYRKKQGMSPLKYIYVIEYVPESEETKKVRIHHHIIMSGMDRNVVESKWKKGRISSTFVQPDEDFGLEGFATYITKLASDGYHRYACSRNLKKPTVYKSVTRLTRKKMYEMIMSGDGIGQMLEDIYKDKYRYLDTKIYKSDWNGGLYIYSRMKRREVKNVGDKENALSGENLKPVRVFIDMEWKGNLQKGNALYTIILETQYKGAPYTKYYHGEILNTTKNRAILYITRIALGHMPRKYNLEVHAPGDYLAGGFNLCRFQSAREKEYQSTKNADLIEPLLKNAAGHAIRVVPEEKNSYSDWAKRERNKPERESGVWEKTIDDKR